MNWNAFAGTLIGASIVAACYGSIFLMVAGFVEDKKFKVFIGAVGIALSMATAIGLLA